MDNYYYLGAFPPPFGGVTVKNSNLFIALNKRLDIKKIDFSEIKKKNVKTIVSFVHAFLGQKNVFLIGVAGKNTRRNLCKLLYYLNRKAMRRSLIFLMGGSVSHVIASDKEYQKYISMYKAVYVETQGMKAELANTGLNNIHIYPNCRFKLKKQEDTVYKKAGKFSCVFFSRVTPDKGIDIILDAAKNLSSVEFHLYGEIDSTYSDIFNNKLGGFPNVTYHGVFKGRGTEVYDELARYDVMLLPTKWRNEGVPGVLIEAKIAGVPSIVSNICYNAEIIEDGVSGIVLKKNTVENLVEVIERLDKNRVELYRLKVGAKQSAEMYYIENYIGDILKKLEE